MQYLVYCVVCFKVQSTIGEVFVANVVEVALANCGIFMHRHAKDAKFIISAIQGGLWDPIPF
jgi:hypothetical protein